MRSIGGPVTIVVTHLTRMRGGHICIAGLDTTSNKHVRPVLGRAIERAFLTQGSSEIRIGSTIQFARMTPVPNPPEIEDCLFQIEECTLMGQVSVADIRKFCSNVARIQLTDIFGPLLHRNGRTWALPEGQGAASLGVLRGAVVGAPHVDGYGNVRMTVDDGAGQATVPVTDLRLFKDDGETPNQRAILEMKVVMRNRDVLLSVGVGRAWARDNEAPVHWLQVNNIHV